jgi:hypothetical protein
VHPTATTNPLHRQPLNPEPKDAYDTWVFDCDGTLWRGNTLIDGAKEALQLLRDQVGGLGG